MRLLWICGLIVAAMMLLAAPAGAVSPAQRRAIIRTVQQYHWAATSSPVRWERYCGLLAAEPRQSLARFLPALVDKAPSSCAGGGKALQAAWPYRLVHPEFRARDRRQTQRDIAAGKVYVFGNGTATLQVRWHGSGCIPGAYGSWDLQRVGRRWLISEGSLPSWPCLSRPATKSQAQALRSLFAAHINALEQQDPQGFCETSNIFDLRLSAFSEGWDLTQGFECAAFVRSSLIGSDLMEDIPKYRELLPRAQWVTVAYGAAGWGKVNGQYLSLEAYYLGGNRWKAIGLLPVSGQCCEILE